MKSGCFARTASSADSRNAAPSGESRKARRSSAVAGFCPMLISPRLHSTVQYTVLYPRVSVVLHILQYSTRVHAPLVSAVKQKVCVVCCDDFERKNFTG